MNRRPSITNIVSSFEKVITKNREYGCDRDILGNNNKSSIPPASRRASYSHRKEWKSSRELGQMKKKSFPTQQRRITLVDAMSASTTRRRQSLGESPRSHCTPLVSTKQESQSLKKSSNSAVNTINKKKHVTTKKKKSQLNNNVIKKKPKANAPATMQPRNNNEMVVEGDDDEIKALREKIAALQAQLQQVEHYEKRQLAAIAQDKTEQKARYRNRQSSKRNVLVADDESSNLQKRQAKKQQKVIEKLRHDNKQLRQESRDLAIDIRQLHESNASLERAHQTTQTYFGELSEFHDSEKDIYKRYSDVLPKFQGKVSELDSESAMRGAWIAMEQNIQDKYQKCQESIVALVEARCDDEDLVDNVVRLSLGLEIE